MLTQLTAVSTLLSLAAAAPIATASPISIQGVHNSTYNDFGVQRASGGATIFGDLDGDGTLDPLAVFQFREREAWLSSDTALPNYIDTPSIVHAQLDPSDPSGGTLRAGFSSTSLGGRQFLRNRVEVTVFSMQQGLPSTGIANFIFNDPGGNVFNATFALDYGGGRTLNLNLISLIIPQYQRIGGDISQLDAQRMDARTHMGSVAPIPAGTLSEFNILSLTGDLVPSPGPLAILACGILAVARRRRAAD